MSKKITARSGTPARSTGLRLPRPCKEITARSGVVNTPGCGIPTMFGTVKVSRRAASAVTGGHDPPLLGSRQPTARRDRHPSPASKKITARSAGARITGSRRPGGNRHSQNPAAMPLPTMPRVSGDRRSARSALDRYPFVSGRSRSGPGAPGGIARGQRRPGSLAAMLDPDPLSMGGLLPCFRVGAAGRSDERF